MTTDRSKAPLDPGRADRLLAEVTDQDRARAREAIAAGVREAQEHWIETRLIAEALALELIALGRGSGTAGEVAAHLRSLAALVEAQEQYH